MKVIRVKDANEGGKKHLKSSKMEWKRRKVLGLATGSTPETLYKEMTSSDLDFQK